MKTYLCYYLHAEISDCLEVNYKGVDLPYRSMSVYCFRGCLWKFVGHNFTLEICVHWFYTEQERGASLYKTLQKIGLFIVSDLWCLINDLLCFINQKVDIVAYKEL